MQRCCHLSTYIVPFHTRKVNRNFTKKTGQRAKDSAGFLAILTKSIRDTQGASFRAHRTYIRNKCSLLIQNICSLYPNIRSGFVCLVSEQMFGIVSNIRSLLVRTQVRLSCEHMFFYKRTFVRRRANEKPLRRRGDFIQLDVITE